MKKSGRFHSLLLILVLIFAVLTSHAQWSTKVLSQARGHLEAASVGTKAFFAGGTNGAYSNIVDIYELGSNSWSTATLSQARTSLSAASVGRKVFFAGGELGFLNYSDRVDIYDNAINTWSTASLSQARFGLSSSAVGTKVFFAGGWHGTLGYFDVVDIYDNSNNTWNTASLSQARANLSATSNGTKIYFAGGYTGNAYSSVVDIYDNNSNTWTIANLSQARAGLSAVSVGTKVFFAGGSSNGVYSNVVDIYDSSTNTWTTSNLSQPRSSLGAVSVGGKVFFAGGATDGGNSAVVDIYDTNTGTWSTASLTQARNGLATTFVGTQVLFAGGYIDNGVYSNVVDIFENDFISGTTSDISGNNYNTVIIGTQEWLKENLRTTKYANGDVIPIVADNQQWAALSTGALCYYNNDNQYNTPHGKLYNWYAVIDQRGLCPNGWRTPSAEDWRVLYDLLGGQAVAGFKMKSTTGWFNDTNGSNASGFNGYPSGGRETDGFTGFANITGYGYLWSSTETDVGVASIRLNFYSEGLSKTEGALKTAGLSVRCLKNQKQSQSISFLPLNNYTYGDPPFSLAATASSELPVSYTSSNTSVATINGSTVTIVGAGITVITALQIGDENFDSATSVERTLTVNKANQSINFSTLSNKTYGDSPFALIASSDSGLPVSFISSNPNIASIEGAMVTIRATGTVIITASQLGNEFYDTATPIQQNLVINKATLTATADNKSRVYGDANPVFTISYSGFKNGETASVIDTAPTATTTATVTSNVGSYNIVPAGGMDNNYSFMFVNGTLTVTKALLTATADNKSREYGAANPAFTISYSGFKNSETASVIDTAPTATSSATSTSNVGLYDIVLSGGLDNNYDFNYIKGTLTITKATLTARADDKTRLYGEPNPTFTITYSGFKNGETAAVIDTPPLATTSATIESLPAIYSIVPSGGIDNNYDFNYVNGNLTIQKLSQSITFDLPESIYQDESPYPLVASASSGLPVSFSIVSGNGTIDGANLIITGSGPIVVKAFQEGNDVYTYAEVVKTTNVKSTYNVSGLVTKATTGGVLKTGLAKLFNLDGGIAKMVDVVDGILLISGIRAGDYILQIIPLGNESSDVFPTYYQSAQLHPDADVLSIQADVTISLVMIAKPNKSVGASVVRGQVSGDYSSGSRQSAEDGIPNLPVYLLEDNSLNVFASSVTDEDGNYEFLNLPDGNYAIALDLLGTELGASSKQIVVDGSVDRIEVNITVMTEGVTTVGFIVNVITGIENNQFVEAFYPNPSKGYVIIELSNEQVGTLEQLSIYAIDGKHIKTIRVTGADSKIEVDVSDTESGIYLMYLNFRNARSQLRFVRD